MSEAGARAWVKKLSPHGAVDFAQAACPWPIIEETIALVGEDPVRWAVELGSEVAARILKEVPSLGGGAGARERLRRGTEASAVQVLAALAGPSGERPPISEPTAEGMREYVHRAIPLEQVLRGLRIAHALTTEAFHRACAELLDPSAVIEELTAVTQELFGRIDKLTDAMIREYLTEHAAWSVSTAAARAGAVRALLSDSPPADTEQASRTLGYDLDRTHVAVVLWSDSPTANPALQTAATEMLRSHGATATLVVPMAPGQVWAWGAVRAPMAGSADARALAPGLQPQHGLHVGIGLPANGVDGFRRSHAEAGRTERFEHLRREAGQRPRESTAYADVAVAALLTADLTAAGELVRRELGALAERTETMAILRTTLRHYLDAERSLVTVAQRLHIARGTVTYRVRRAQEVLERAVDERPLALRTALELADELGDAVLR
ncbi:PucR family transcriptional regulator [Amycolatopsis sp. NPDC059027]|uniref:PucR family transcriptional regulator n=1 Tax=unclassified Amycolatopsis TaxID=2618356 RepID=UPI003670680D